MRITIHLSASVKITFDIDLDFNTLDERPARIKEEAIKKIKERYPDLQITNDDFMIVTSSNPKAIQEISLTGREDEINLVSKRTLDLSKTIALPTSAELYRLYLSLMESLPFNNIEMTHPRTHQHVLISQGLNDIIFFDESLFGRQFDSSDKTIQTYGDGNCAFNASVMVIVELILMGQADLENPLIKALYKQFFEKDPPANLVAMKRDFQNGLRAALGADANTPADQIVSRASSNNLNVLQAKLQPILRQQVVNWIETNRTAKDYEEAFLGSYDALLRNERDDTFVVHSHIAEQFKKWQTSSPPPSEEECRQWWRTEGFSKYIATMKQNARSGFDQERWGSEVEMGALAEMLNINIFFKGRGFTEETILGPGGGYIFDLSYEDRMKLSDLGLGYNNKDRPVFVLFHNLTREAIERAFQPNLYLEQVRAYFTDPSNRTKRKLPDDWTDPVMLNALTRSGVIDPRKRLWITDDARPDSAISPEAKQPAVDRIIESLIGDRALRPDKRPASAAAAAPSIFDEPIISLEPDKSLKTMVLEKWRPGLPAFYTKHGGAHWEYRIPSGQREIPILLEQITSRALTLLDKTKALIPGKKVHILLPLVLPNHPHPVAVYLEYVITPEKNLKISNVRVFDPNNDPAITNHFTAWFHELRPEQFIQIPVLTAKSNTGQLHTVFNFMCFSSSRRILNQTNISSHLAALLPPNACYLSDALQELLQSLRQREHVPANEQEKINTGIRRLRQALLIPVEQPEAVLQALPEASYPRNAPASFIAAEHRRCVQLHLDPSHDSYFSWILKTEVNLICSKETNPKRIVDHFDRFRSEAEQLLALIRELKAQGSAADSQLQQAYSFADTYLNSAIDDFITETCSLNRVRVQSYFEHLLFVRKCLESLYHEDSYAQTSGHAKKTNKDIDELDQKLIELILLRFKNLALVGTSEAHGLVGLLRCLEVLRTNKQPPFMSENNKEKAEISVDKLRALLKETGIEQDAQDKLFDELNWLVQKEKLTCVSGKLPPAKSTSYFPFFSRSFWTSPSPPSPSSFRIPPQESQLFLEIKNKMEHFANINTQIDELIKNPVLQKAFKEENVYKRYLAWFKDCQRLLKDIGDKKNKDPDAILVTLDNALKGFKSIQQNVLALSDTALKKNELESRDRLNVNLSEILGSLQVLYKDLPLPRRLEVLKPPPSSAPKGAAKK